MLFVKKGIIIFIGSLFIAIGINGFLVPFGLIDGGALGISLIFHYAFGVRVGLTFMFISIPIFWLAWIHYRSFFYNGLHGMLLSSLIIDVLATSPIFEMQLVASPLVSAMYGGIIIGIGIGVMLRVDISIGGVDLLAQMLAKRLNMNAGIAIFCFDIIIVTVGSFIIHSAHLLLSFTTVFFAGLAASFIVFTGRSHASGIAKQQARAE